jgi:hypothetical protein
MGNLNTLQENKNKNTMKQNLKNLELEEGTTLCIEIFQREWNPGKVTR